MHLKKVCFLLIIIFLSQSISLCIASSEPDWPIMGYIAYLESDNSAVIIRDQQNNLAGRMILSTPGIIDQTNVSESILYEEKYGVRWATKDVNKNGVFDFVYEEDFNSYPLGEDPSSALSNVPFKIGGYEQEGQGIAGSNTDHMLHFFFDSPENVLYEGAFPYAPVRVDQKTLFSPTLDCADTYISFDLKTTGITADIPQALAVEVYARSHHPVTGQDYGYLACRVQNYPSHAPSYAENSDYLRPLPESSQGTVVTFNINDLVFVGSTFWKVADFSDVSEFKILLLQVDTDESGELHDWVARGSVGINNFRVGKDNEPLSQTPLEVELTFDNAVSTSFKPGEKITVEINASMEGNVIDTVTDIQVFDSTFSWSNKSASKIYDSVQSGDSVVSFIGLGETETSRFTFTIPPDAPEGDYRVFGTIKDNEGTVIDTTGPDISMNDTTILAYINRFSVSENIGSGPVAYFDTELSDPDNGDMVLTLDASRSFHQSSSYQIINYEWDLDGNGISEYQSVNPVIHVVIPNVTMPVMYPVMLKVSDNNMPAEYATESELVNVVRVGDASLEAGTIDDNSSYPVKWYIFDTDYRFVDKKVSDITGTTSWQDVPAVDYIAEGYVYNETIFPSIELASIEFVTVEAGIGVSKTVTHTAPYVSNVEIQYADTSMVLDPSTALPIEPGRLLNFNITVQNDSNYDRACNVTLVLDKNKDKFFDISVNPTDDSIVPAGDLQVFSVSVSPPEPDNEAEFSIEEYWYAVKVATESIAGRVKTAEYGWNKAFNLKSLPPRTVAGSLTFCGYEFDVVKFFRFAGVTADNVWTENDGSLSLRVQDYSGVGGELVTPRVDYHYGVYKAAMKVSPTQTELPEGTVMAFFHYWQSEAETELQEIDVELRSMSRNGEQSISYADFTVHNKKTTDSVTHNVSFSCPIENIEEEHIYEFRWKSDEIAFYVDGELAYDRYGNPAIVNESSIDSEGEAFVGRIPDQPGRIIINHWAGDWANTWAGSSPQGKGDYIANVSYIDFQPVFITGIGKNSQSQSVLNLYNYNNSAGSSTNVSIYAVDSLDDLPNWFLLDSDVTVSTDYMYTDLTSGDASSRFYKIKYD